MITETETTTIVAPGPGIYEERPACGCPGYTVSNDGRVFSLKHGRRRELRQSFAGRGYRKVSPCIEGKNVTRYVHQLVCETFHGPRPEGQEVRHVDTNKENNAASNLAWGTPEENRQDNHCHGKYVVGTEQHAAKLNDESVREIRRLISQRVPEGKIAARFGVAKSQIWLIKTGRTWKHVA